MEEKSTENIHQTLLAVVGDTSYLLKSDTKVNNQVSFSSHE